MDKVIERLENCKYGKCVDCKYAEFYKNIALCQAELIKDTHKELVKIKEELLSREDDRK